MLLKCDFCMSHIAARAHLQVAVAAAHFVDVVEFHNDLSKLPLQVQPNGLLA